MNKRNLFTAKKGSVFLSLMASGAIAATIVATHQMVKNFNTASVTDRQQAYILGQKALSLASMLVMRNVVLCSGKTSGSTVEGCTVDKLDPEDSHAESFLSNMGLSDSGNDYRDSFSSVTGGAGAYGDIIQLNRAKIKSSSPLYGVEEIEWSLRRWTDPSIKAVFNSAFSKGYFCEDKDTHEVIENGICDKLPIEKTSAQILSGDIECKDSSGSAISGSVCNYFPISDYDGQMVYITVKIPYTGLDQDQTYEETTTNSGTTTTANKQTADAVKRKTLVLGAAIRRPIALLTFSPQSRPNCSQKCEAALSGTKSGTKINSKPRCVGLSNYSISTSSQYQSSVPTAPFTLKVTNHGPGVLYDLKLKREDIKNDGSNDVLSSAMFEPSTLDSSDGKISPNESVSIEDKIPCYATTYYNINVETISCNCNFGSLPKGQLPSNQLLNIARNKCNEALGGALSDSNIQSLIALEPANPSNPASGSVSAQVSSLSNSVQRFSIDVASTGTQPSTEPGNCTITGQALNSRRNLDLTRDTSTIPSSTSSPTLCPSWLVDAAPAQFRFCAR